MSTENPCPQSSEMNCLSQRGALREGWGEVSPKWLFRSFFWLCWSTGPKFPEFPFEWICRHFTGSFTWLYWIRQKWSWALLSYCQLMLREIYNSSTAVRASSIKLWTSGCSSARKVTYRYHTSWNCSSLDKSLKRLSNVCHVASKE